MQFLRRKCPVLFPTIENRHSKIQSGWGFRNRCRVHGGWAVAQAQQPTKIPRIGYLAVNSLSDNAARIDAFRQGLRELGYVEGKNIIIEWRSAEGKPDRLPALAAELVSLQVDVIVSYGPTPTRAAKKATTKIPIVMSV